MSRRIVLVDHGSPRDEANRTSERLAAELGRRLDAAVIATHMELAQPAYAATLAALGDDATIREVVVIPLFFVAGKHWHDDIIAPLDDLRRRRPDMTLRIGAPLVDDPAFTVFLAARVEALLTGG